MDAPLAFDLDLSPLTGRPPRPAASLAPRPATSGAPVTCRANLKLRGRYGTPKGYPQTTHGTKARDGANAGSPSSIGTTGPCGGSRTGVVSCTPDGGPARDSARRRSTSGGAAAFPPRRATTIVRPSARPRWDRCRASAPPPPSLRGVAVTPVPAPAAAEPTGVVPSARTVEPNAAAPYSLTPPAARHPPRPPELVAQLVEQRTFNPWVVGSSPTELIVDNRNRTLHLPYLPACGSAVRGSSVGSVHTVLVL